MVRNNGISYIYLIHLTASSQRSVLEQEGVVLYGFSDLRDCPKEAVRAFRGVSGNRQEFHISTFSME